MTRVFPLHMPSAVAADAHPAKPNIFRRLSAAVIESRRRRAEREIARYLARSGMKLTDAAEREIERQFFHRPFN
jgi:hypothetical protein